MRQIECGTSPIRTIAKAAYVVFAIVAFFGVAIAVREGKTEKIDHQVTRYVQGIGGNAFRQLMNIVSWPGFPPQSRILPLLIPALILIAGYPRAAKYQLAAWGTAVLSGIAKFMMQRPRPDHPEIMIGDGNVTGSSFPSGHVLNYVGVYGFLAYLAWMHIGPAWIRRPVVALLTGLVSLVGISRIYLGHHWFSDVLASYLLGTGYLVALTSLYKRGLCREMEQDNS